MQTTVRTRELEAVSRLSTSLHTVDRLIADSLDALGGIIEFDLATVMEIRGDQLAVRVARGRLADDRVAGHKLTLGSFPEIASVLEAGTARVFEDHDHADGDGDPFDGVLDLGVMYTPQGRPGFQVEMLFEDEIVLVSGNPQDRGGPGENYVLIDWGPEFRADHALNFPDISMPGTYLELGSLSLQYLAETGASGYVPRRLLSSWRSQVGMR